MKPTDTSVRFGESFRVKPQLIRNDGSLNPVTAYLTHQEQDNIFPSIVIGELAKEKGIAAATDLRKDGSYVHVNGPKRQSYDEFAPLNALKEEAIRQVLALVQSGIDLEEAEQKMEQLKQVYRDVEMQIDELALVSEDTPELPLQYELREGKPRLLNADEVARTLRLDA